MKRYGKKIKGLKLPVAAVALAVLAGFVAFAAADDLVRGDTGPMMQMGMEGVQDGDHLYLGDLETADVYSGSQLKWRVMDANHDNTGKPGAVFVMSEGLIGDKGIVGQTKAIAYYSKWYNPLRKMTRNNFWHNSDMPEWCGKFYANTFSLAEQMAIRPITKKDPGNDTLGLFKDRVLEVNPDGSNTYSDITYNFYSYPDEIREQRVFFPSYKELKDEKDLEGKMQGESGVQQYWLRTPGELYPNYDLFSLTRAYVATYINKSQHKDYGKTHVPDFEYDDIAQKWWARPVTNIERSSVLFSSVPGARQVELGELKKMGNSRDDRDEWDLTVYDKARSHFNVSNTWIEHTTEANYIHMDISNAPSGPHEYISCIVKDEFDRICYYGRLARCDAGAPDKMTIPLTWTDEGDDLKLYVFSEHYVGEKRSSYASPLQFVDVKHPDIPSHTITFDLNGHGGPQPIWQEVDNEGKATEPEAPSAEGYDFMGWYTDPDCNDRWDFDNEVTEDKVLYAKWDPHQYKVCLKPNNGDTVEVFQFRRYEDGVKLPNGAEMFTAPEGKRFDGWNTEADGSGDTYYPGDTNSLSSVQGAVVDLYAMWYEHFTVAFDMNGRGSPKPETALVGEETGWKVEEPTEPTARGYSFGGWYIDPRCEDKDRWHFVKEVPWSMALYAKWVPNSYTIHFDGNGADGEMADQERQVDDGVAIAECTFTNPGKTLKSWNTEVDGSGTRIPAEYKGNLTFEDGEVVNLYAQWGDIEVTFDPGDGRVRPEKMTTDSQGKLETLPVAAPPEGQGLTFKGWYTKTDSGAKITEETVFTKDTTVYARYAAAGSYIIIFDANGGRFTDGKTHEMLTDIEGRLDKLEEAPHPPREGDTYFLGWYTKPDGGARATDGQIFAAETTLYAHWGQEPPRYRIILNANGGTYTNVGPTKTVDTDENGRIGWPETPDSPYPYYPDGTTCKAMFSKDNGGFQITDQMVFKEDTTIYARWDRVLYEDQTVTLHLQDGTGNTMTVGTTYGWVPEDSRYPPGRLDTLPTPVYEGHKFMGWHTKPDGGIMIPNEAHPWVVDYDMHLYALWEPADYSIQFAANGGTGKMDAVERALGDGGTLPENRFTRDGYIFDGWNTEMNGSGTSYTDGFKGDVTHKDELVILYAQWKPYTYTIHYDGNGADSGSMEDQERKFEDGEKLSPNGYGKGEESFICWNTKADGAGVDYENEYEGDFAVENGGSVTLYAQWGNGYTVEFEPNGGEGAMRPQVRAEGRFKPLPPNSFTRTGYEFTNWNSDADGEGTAYPNGFRGRVGEGAVEVLYAQWKANEYTVHYDPNKGTGRMPDQKRSYDDGGSLDDNAFSCEGKAFLEWNTEADGSGTSYSEGYKGDLTGDPNVKITLYAQWRDSYTVHFDANQGEGQMDDQERIIGDGGTLKANTFNREGYTFVDWNTIADGTGATYQDEAVGDLMAGPGTLTLYAQWKKTRVYTITFDANGGQFSDGTSSYTERTDDNGKFDESPRTPETAPEGGSFDGYYTKPDGGVRFYPGMVFESDVTLYAHWSSVRQGFVVTLDPQGGSVDPNQIESIFVWDENHIYMGELPFLPTPTDDYRVFTGWYTQKNGGMLIANDSHALVTSDDTLYAHWRNPEYKVHYDGNGGEGNMPDQHREYNVHEELDPCAFIRKGYVFDSWNTEHDGSGTKYVPNYSGDLSKKDGATVTLYAQWKAQKYTIRFDENGGRGYMDDQDRQEGDGKALPPCLFDPPSHRSSAYFVGWNTKADGSGEYFEDRSTRDVGTTGRVTLYAQWSDHRVAVFDLNGHGSDGPPPQMCGYHQDYKLVEPSKEPTGEEGYTFGGWYKEPTCENLWDFEYDRLTKNLTLLYAKWIPVSYSVHFEPSPPEDDLDVEGTMEDQERTYDDGKALPEMAYTITDPNDASRGFAFTGWNTAEDGSGDGFGDQDAQNITGENGAKVTLYAQWNRAQITTSRLPMGHQGKEYSATLTQEGMVGEVTWGILSGELPEGLRLDSSTGEIYGTTDQAGTFDITMKVTGNNQMGDPITLSKSLSLRFRQQDPEPLIIEFTEGMNGTWEKGSSEDLKFKTNGPFDMFVSLDVDGKELKKGVDYTTAEGSTKIDLKPKYLETLKDGSHVLTAHYSDGQVPFTQFTITSKAKPDGPNDGDSDKNKNRKGTGSGSGSGSGGSGAATGDETHPPAGLILMALALMTGAGVIRRKDRRA